MSLANITVFVPVVEVNLKNPLDVPAIAVADRLPTPFSWISAHWTPPPPQGVQALAPPALHVLGAQEAQEVPAPFVEKVPAGQDWHAVSTPSRKNWPALQHFFTPSLSQWKEPDEHVVVSAQVAGWSLNS